MTFLAEDAPHTTFVALPAPGDEPLVISRAALQLHTFGVLASIEVGDPGFVPDAYLNAISAETSVTAFELCLAGLWTRVPCGYQVSDDETAHVAAGPTEQLREAVLRCAESGGHLPARECSYMCVKCGAPIARERFVSDQ